MKQAKLWLPSGVVALSMLAMVGCSEAERSEAEAESREAASEVERAAEDAADYTEERAEEAGQYIDDATITARVKTALMEADQLDAMEINIETIDATVVLNGVVATDEEADLAEQLAEEIEGVEGVENDIEVRE